MKVDIPEFKRCCYCIPLRYGLLVWAYIKLVITLVVFLFGCLVVQVYIQLMFAFGYGVYPLILTGMALLLFLMVDIGMTIVFIIGGHRKTTKLMNVFYIYNIILTCILAGLLLVSTVYDLSAGDDFYEQYKHSHRQRQLLSFGTMIVTKVVGGVALLGIQAYIVLLLRSEISKLKNARNFRFTNITAEAECSMENITNDPSPGTLVQTNGMNDLEIGIDNQLVGDITNTNGSKGTFNYDKF